MRPTPVTAMTSPLNNPRRLIMNKQQGGSHTPGTPLPWSHDTLRLTPEQWAEARTEIGNTIICSEDGFVSDVLACVIGKNKRQRTERAAYIVRACNAFPELLEALKRLAESADACAWAANTSMMEADIAFARAALAKARPEPSQPPYEEN
jgi:hypothetical protein